MVFSPLVTEEGIKRWCARSAGQMAKAQGVPPSQSYLAVL